MAGPVWLIVAQRNQSETFEDIIYSPPTLYMWRLYSLKNDLFCPLSCGFNNYHLSSLFIMSTCLRYKCEDMLFNYGVEIEGTNNLNERIALGRNSSIYLKTPQVLLQMTSFLQPGGFLGCSGIFEFEKNILMTCCSILT